MLQTNLEAVQEIVRQIRLRDLGGIIVIDLIDMVEAEHREEVFASLESEIKKDRAKTKVLNISEFGLVEITRKRSRSNLERLLTQSLPLLLRARPDQVGRHHLPQPAQGAAPPARPDRQRRAAAARPPRDRPRPATGGAGDPRRAGALARASTS